MSDVTSLIEASEKEAARIPILDHGYLRVDEAWGSDEKIVRAARMSTGKGFLGWDPGPCEACRGTGKVAVATYAPGANLARFRNRFLGEAFPEDYVGIGEGACLACEGKGNIRGDARLLRYLMENAHHTPFEMAGLVVEVQAPIETFRQWQRHRTQGYNEMSGRYVPLPDLNYLPTVERLMMGGGSNKQAGLAAGAGGLTHEAALAWLERLAGVYDAAEDVYQEGLRIGVPKELARLPVPVARYSRMMATAVLRNWLAFLTLRSDTSVRGRHAQWEIRQFANAVDAAIAMVFPRTHELFAEAASRG